VVTAIPYASRTVPEVIRLDAALREAAEAPEMQLHRPLLAHVVHVPPGDFYWGERPEHSDQWLGLLVLDGLIVSKLAVGRAHIGCLIGDDDVISPWTMGDVSLTQEVAWLALRPTRLAVLDAEFNRRAGGIPLVTRALLSRALKTSQWLQATSLVVSSPVIDERLLLLFAMLGERWGTVTPEGVRLDLRLTHSVLSVLCGARRPSVTLALRSLQAAGLLARDRDGAWIMRRDAGDLAVPRQPCWPEYAGALGLR
jgi:CRP/FNR family cyclic AMP-dependent transcriptional regulator